MKQFKKHTIWFCCMGLLVSFFMPISGQDVPIGNWVAHLPYNDVYRVAEIGSKIYGATGSAIFYYDKNDNSLNPLSKTTGLSDVGVNALGSDPSTSTLVLGYINSNIDLLYSDEVINIPDIKRKSIPGDKAIYSISFIEGKAHLACGFGIVVLDVANREISDTYHINSNNSAVYDIVLYQDTIYAASEVGLYKAPKQGQNLVDYNSWERVGQVAAVKIQEIEVFQSRLIINLAGVDDPATLDDTLMCLENNTWSYWDTGNAKSVRSISSFDEGLMVTQSTGSYQYNQNLALVSSYTNPVLPQHAIIDSDGTIWIADSYAGLIRNNASWGIYPNGPKTDNVFDMDIVGDDLWVAPGGRTNSWGNAWISDGVFNYLDHYWSGYSYNQLNSINDITVIAIDPGNDQHVCAGTWGHGILEFNNGELAEHYQEGNSDSALESIIPGENYIRIGGLDFDNSGNLWVGSTEVDNLLSVRRANGTWHAFQFSGLGLNTRVGKVMVDQRNWKWVLLPGNGILVFDDNDTPGSSNDDSNIILKTSAGNGNLPDNDVGAIVEDLDGEIWIGTSTGIAVFYSPELVFSGNDFDAQQILVQQDSSYHYLLEAEIITAIVADGANRKWIGTETAGVFLMSEDGTEEISHFTMDNSPLPSDHITTIAVNYNNGTVFLGTSAGLVSYKGTATGGSTSHTNVYAYPNPVRETYNGLIAIKGLVTDADVKITDISGNLIYQTPAFGGQAIWDGHNFSGQRAKSGVYLVFSTSDDGTQKAVTKILFIN
jgi:hypothetical protein